MSLKQKYYKWQFRRTMKRLYWLDKVSRQDFPDRAPADAPYCDEINRCIAVAEGHLKKIKDNTQNPWD